MENQVEEIKQKLDIVDIISKYIPVQKRGRHFMACCPFHQEKTPSFTISQELQIFKCFGCGKSGDMFTFVQEYDRVEFRESMEILAKFAGVELKKSDFATHEESRQKVLIRLNSEIAKFYNYILLSHPAGKEALDYVLGRGITKETIEKFMIGFSPQNSSLITTYLFKKDFKKEDLIATGTFGESKYGNTSLYDRFQDRLIFPLYDYRDRVLGFSGRILPTAKNPNLAKYINSPETEIYHKSHMLFGLNVAKDSIRHNNAVIVTEGEFDMISPYQIGVNNIVALKGTAFTIEQLQLLRRYTDTLILALDSDFAGNNAARKSIELADSLNFDIRVLTLGDKYKDPDEAVKGDPNFFKEQLKNTIPVWDFIIDSVIKANDIDTIKGKKEVLSIVLPFLSKIKNENIKMDYLQSFAYQIGNDVNSILEEVKKQNLPAPTNNNLQFSVSTSIIPPKNSRLENLEEYLLLLILGSKRPDILSQKLKNYLLEFSNQRYSQIIEKLIKLEEFNVQNFQSELTAEIRPLFQNLFLKATDLAIHSEDRPELIKKTVNQISLIVIEEKIKQNSMKMAQLEAKNEDTNALDLETNQLIIQRKQLLSKKA